jgi:hypothetical protein
MLLYDSKLSCESLNVHVRIDDGLPISVEEVVVAQVLLCCQPRDLQSFSWFFAKRRLMR